MEQYVNLIIYIIYLTE